MKEVVCLVFEDQGNFLLEQRLDKIYHGDWMFPGGKVEEIDYQSENYLLTASVRESDQEDGLVPEEIVLFTSFAAIPKEGREFLFQGIHVRRYSGVLQNKEPDKRVLAWVPKAEVGACVVSSLVDNRIWQDFLKQRGSVL